MIRERFNCFASQVGVSRRFILFQSGVMGKERKKEEERSYLLIESYVREQREGIYRFDINFQKKENSKQGREWLLIDNPINNRISSFELYPIIRTRSINPHRKWREEPEEFIRVCETLKPLGSSTLQKKKKKAIFQQWPVEKRGILELLRCDSPGKIALVNTFRADVAAAMLRIVDKFRV